MTTSLDSANKMNLLQRRATASLLLVAMPMFTLLSGCKKKDDAAAADEAPTVSVEGVHPETGSISENIEADAVLAPVAQAAIQARIAAPIKRYYVQRGSHVKAGQLLATLENSDLAAAALDNQGAVTQAKGSYASAVDSQLPQDQTQARLDVQQAKATYDLNNSILEARRQLLAQGAIPGRDFDTAKATAQQSEAAYQIAKLKLDRLQKVGNTAIVDQAKGSLTSAQAKLQGAQAQLSYTSLRTPISGVVTDRPFFPGETPAAGTALITVMDTSTLLAKLHIAQDAAQQLHVGSKATIAVAGMDEPVPAAVSLISPALDPGSTTVEVWLKVPNAKGEFKAGTSVHAVIKGNTVNDALLIPTEAVQRSSEGSGKQVMILTADGTAKKQAVTVGISNKETTQITSGLKADDTVLTTGAYGLDDGTKVKVEAAADKDAADGKDAADEKGGDTKDSGKKDAPDAADDKKSAAEPKKSGEK